MPLKLNVGLSKKIGLPDFGSLGASCHVEVELDGALLRSDLDGFHKQVKSAFTACRQAVSDELSRAVASTNGQTQPDSVAAAKSESRAQSNGNGHAPGAATEKQVRYARQLAGQIGGLGLRGLDTLSQRMFEKPMAALAGLEVSALIDMLKAIKEGHVQLDAALSGAAE